MRSITTLRPLLLASLLGLAAPWAALADAPAAPPAEHGIDGHGPDHGMGECPMHGGEFHPGMMGGGMMHGHGPFDGEDGMSPMLHRLHLTEVQQDKVFNILHAQAPQARELRKAERAAHRGLHELMMSGAYDDAKAKKLADQLGKAEADATLLHARTHHQILEVLTAEQREMLARHGAHHDGEPGEHHHDDHVDGPRQ